MSTVLAVSPHPDDETFGCGGTLLRHIADGDQVHWLIVTDMRIDYGFSEAMVRQRQTELKKVATAYGFTSVHNLEFPPAKLDTVPKIDLIQSVGHAITQISPEVIYLPFRGDVHSDHAAVFDAVIPCTKWFRYPGIRRVVCYETLSETEFDLNPESTKFNPNSFVDISSFIDRKIEIAKIYASEIRAFPFPRSEEALESLARLRGATCGCQAAEAFMLLREINK